MIVLQKYRGSAARCVSTALSLVTQLVTEVNKELASLNERLTKLERGSVMQYDLEEAEERQSKKHHVACDLDGTLAHYDGWQGIENIGAPIPEVLSRVKALLEAGHQVSIYTSRVAGDWPEHIKDLEATRRHIERWCYEHIGRILPITAVKHGWFTEFWDDKALGIRENQGMPVTTRDAWTHST